jgi:hypothetical protein
MSIFLLIIAGILTLLTLSGLISAIKNRDTSVGFISVIFLFIAFVPAYFGYMQMGLVGIVEYASDVEIGENELGTVKCQFTVKVRNEDGGQDTIVWTGVRNDERYADAEEAVNPKVDNATGESKLFKYKRCEIQ